MKNYRLQNIVTILILLIIFYSCKSYELNIDKMIFKGNVSRIYIENLTNKIEYISVDNIETESINLIANNVNFKCISNCLSTDYYKKTVDEIFKPSNSYLIIISNSHSYGYSIRIKEIRLIVVFDGNGKVSFVEKLKNKKVKGKIQPAKL